MDTIKHWQNLTRALEYYTDIGYEYINTPWIVDDKTIRETLPYTMPYIGVTSTIMLTEGLVGSAEQGFISMIDSLENNKDYCSLTPCFREEENGYDEIHFPWFMKVELFCKNPNEDEYPALDRFHEDAFNLFKELNDNKTLGFSLTKENDIEDINLNDIEIGSYGYRKLSDGNRILFGTGLAEPRFSIAKNKRK